MADLPIPAARLQKHFAGQTVIVRIGDRQQLWLWVPHLEGGRHVLIGRSDLIRRFGGEQEANEYLTQFPVVSIELLE